MERVRIPLPACKPALRLLVLSLLLTASGCSEQPVQPASAAAPEHRLVWPKSAAAPRLRFLRSVASASDWGIAKGFLARVIDGLTGKEALHFVRPTGVAERDGVLYVADPGAQALFVFDVKQNHVLQQRRVGQELLVSPVAVALGPAGTLFLVDSWHKKVYMLDRNGQLRREVAHQGLERPAAVAYDADGERLYVADSKGHHVLVFAPDGRQLQSFGNLGKADGQFNSPTHLAVTRDGNLLVTDALNFRVQAFDRSGRFLWKIGRVGDGSGDFAAPKGIAADREGHVLVVDALFDAVQIFKPDGTLLLGFGERGTRAGQFWLPNGIFVDPQDIVYVADAYNRRIQVFQRIADGEPGAAQ